MELESRVMWDLRSHCWDCSPRGADLLKNQNRGFNWGRGIKELT